MPFFQLEIIDACVTYIEALQDQLNIRQSRSGPVAAAAAAVSNSGIMSEEVDSVGGDLEPDDLEDENDENEAANGRRQGWPVSGGGNGTAAGLDSESDELSEDDSEDDEEAADSDMEEEEVEDEENNNAGGSSKKTDSPSTKDVAENEEDDASSSSLKSSRRPPTSSWCRRVIAEDSLYLWYEENHRMKCALIYRPRTAEAKYEDDKINTATTIHV